VLTHNWSIGSLIGLIGSDAACTAASVRLIVPYLPHIPTALRRGHRRCALNDFRSNRPAATQ
jgi:hypothetical protein